MQLLTPTLLSSVVDSGAEMAKPRPVHTVRGWRDGARIDCVMLSFPKRTPGGAVCADGDDACTPHRH